MLVLALMTIKNLLLADEKVWHGNNGVGFLFYCVSFSAVPFAYM